MAQQVTVTSDDATVELRPLLEAAIRTELHMLELELNRTRRVLAEFELRYGRTSEEFDRSLDAGEIENKADSAQWAREIKRLRRLEAQRVTLKAAQLA